VRIAARVCLASLAMAMAFGCSRRSLRDTTFPDASAKIDAGGTDAGGAIDATGATNLDGPITDAGTDGIGADTRHDGARGGIGDMCWSDGDCVPPPFQPPPPPFCQAPDGTATVTFGCPFCLPPGMLCAADGDCASQGPTWICVVATCTCTKEKSCVAGCASDTDCRTGYSCGADHRCAPSACGAGAPACPTDFVCGAGQTCQRRPCTDDAECSSACVIGKCFDRPGRCSAVPL
jgi:hypothetical protein